MNNSLVAIIKSDPKGALMGLFSQIHQNTDSDVRNEVVRERCIKFLSTKVKQLGREIITKEAEDLIIAECKKILEVNIWKNININLWINSCNFLYCCTKKYWTF